MTRAHEKAWLAWLASAMVVAFAMTNPFAVAAAAGTVIVVGLACAPRGADGRPFRLLVALGVSLTVIRVLLFGLTGHVGPTTLVTLPAARLPSWLGGFVVGGRVTGEVVAQQLLEGARMLVILAATGVVLSVVPVARLLRLVPRRLFEAGLIVGIAVTFVPSIARRAGEVRDAQRLRGHRFRGLRSVRPLVVPVLADALERSLALAASMEMRGFGRRARRAVGDQGHGARAGERTRLRARPLDRFDRAIVGGAVLTTVAALAIRALEAASWYAYPALVAPVFDLRVLGVATLPAIPLVVELARSARVAGAASATATAREAVEASS